MGKYSLENYERYKMIRCRPEEDRTDRPGAGISSFRTVRLRPEDRPTLSGATLLKITVNSLTGTFTETEAAVRKLACHYSRETRLAGVTLDTCFDGSRKTRLLETVAEAFAPVRCFIPSDNPDMLDYALKHGFAGGLLIEVKGNPLDCCEKMAEANAQQLYKRLPVYVSFDRKDPALDQFAQQWHAAAVENSTSVAGPRIALRRLNYPEVLSSGGFAPMQFWWTNRGPSFCYDKATLRLRLTKDGKTVSVFKTGDAPELIPLADRVYNRIIRLPEIPEGEYDVEFGMFTENGAPLVMANRHAVSDGYWFAGRMKIDETPRPEYEHIWDGYAADGYYPLEDPAQPE